MISTCDVIFMGPTLLWGKGVCGGAGGHARKRPWTRPHPLPPMGSKSIWAPVEEWVWLVHSLFFLKYDLGGALRWWWPKAENQLLVPEHGRSPTAPLGKEWKEGAFLSASTQASRIIVPPLPCPDPKQPWQSQCTRKGGRNWERTDNVSRHKRAHRERGIALLGHSGTLIKGKCQCSRDGQGLVGHQHGTQLTRCCHTAWICFQKPLFGLSVVLF